MATEIEEWNANMVFCGSNANPSPQTLDWNLSHDLIALGSHSTIHIINQSAEIISTNQILTGHSSSVSCLKWLSPPNPSHLKYILLLVSGATNGDIKIWEPVGKLECTHTLSIGSSSINSIAARITSPEILIAVAYSSNVTIFRRDTEEKFQELHRINFGYSYVLGVDIGYIGTGTELVPVLACGCDSGKVELYSIIDLRKICDLLGHEDWVRNVEFCGTSENLFLATASQDSYVRIWRLTPKVETAGSTELELKEITFHTSTSPGSLLYRVALETVLHNHEDWCYSVAWSPVSSGVSSRFQLLTASMDRTVAVWSPSGSDGVWEVSMRAGEVGGNTLGLYGARFGPGGVKIVAHGYQGALHLWEKVSGKWHGKCVAGGHFGPVTDLTWSPSGTYLISVSSDQTARLWAEWHGKWHELSRTQIHGYDLVRCCAISDTMYVSSADEKVVRVFRSPATFIDNFKHLTGHTISMPLEAPLGATVPALGLSNKAVFEATQDTKTGKLDTFQDFKNAPQFAPLTLSTPPLEDTLLQHTLWPEVKKLYGHSFEVFALAVSRDGAFVASAAKATKPEHAGIILWSVGKWTHLQTLYFHTLTVSKLAFSNDSNRLLGVSRDRTWSLWKRNGMQFELESHSKLSAVKHSRIIWDCSWTMDDGYFATGSRDRKILVWGIVSHVSPSQWDCVCKEPLTLDDAITALEFCHFSKQRHILGVGLENGNILIVNWNAEVRELSVATYFPEFHVAMVTCVAWRPNYTKGMQDGAYQLATSSADHSVRIYNITTTTTTTTDL